MAFEEQTKDAIRARGFVSRKFDDRGFGYILSSDRTEYFFHARDLKGVNLADLKVNVLVDFDPIDMSSERARCDSRKQVRDRAANVRLVVTQQRAA